MNKKVAVISSSYYGQIMGGAEYQQFLLARYLKKLGHRVSYIFIDNASPKQFESEIQLLGIKKRALLRRLLGRYFFMDFFKLYARLKEVEPDLVLIRGGFAYVGIAAKYCRNHQCRLIWQIASRRDLESFKPKLSRTVIFDFIDKKFLEYGIKNAESIIGQADYQNDLLYRNYKRRCELIVPNFHPLPTEKIEKKTPTKIVWVANFKELKRPEIFVRLARELRSRHNVKFIMIGRNSRNGNLRAIFEEIKRAENIEYKGELPIDDVNRILSTSHILVNTSRIEGFPNTFIQAWMRKVPVVSLDIDPDHIIAKNRIGFRSGDFEQMVKDIEVLISDERLRADMGERAQQFAFQHFSLGNLGKISDLIDSDISF